MGILIEMHAWNAERARKKQAGAPAAPATRAPLHDTEPTHDPREADYFPGEPDDEARIKLPGPTAEEMQRAARTKLLEQTKSLARRVKHKTDHNSRW